MAILYLLARGEAGQPYNVTNRDTAVSIREMAELVCDTVGEGKIRVKIDIPEDVSGFGYNPEMVIRLDPSRVNQRKVFIQPADIRVNTIPRNTRCVFYNRYIITCQRVEQSGFTHVWAADYRRYRFHDFPFFAEPSPVNFSFNAR